MFRKTTAAVVFVGALALGTASATSLGDFDDVTFAASDVDLLNCDLGSDIDLVELLPDLPAVDDTLTYPGETFQLTTLDLSILDTLASDCLTDTLLQVVLLDSAGTVLDVIEVDPDAVDLSSVSVAEVIDIVEIADVRAVLKGA